jgi:C-methyltransferase
MSTETTPDEIIGTLFSFVHTQVLRTAIDLAVFDHIAAGARTAAEIAAAAGSDARATRILLDALTVRGVLTKSEDRYSLSQAAEMLLVKKSPAYIGDFSRISVNPLLWAAIGELTTTVRSGEPRQTMAETPDHEFWVEFSRASERASVLPAQFVADKLALAPGEAAEILDVAVGSGVYGISALERYPKARLTALDWGNVLDNARKVAERHGVAERVRWLAGSAFEAPLPDDHFDAIIVSHFYHHFPPEQNVTLSKRLFRALKPGGVLAVHDWVVDEGRAANEPALTFAVVMLSTTPLGDVYSLSEYRGMLESAGFTGITVDEIPMLATQVILARRPA